MMRRIALGIVCLSIVSAAFAGIDPTLLPSSDHYQGRHSFAVNDGGSFLQGHLEFAVYDTQQQTLTGYDRGERFVYAYQIFNYNSSTAPIKYFALLGFNGSGTADIIDSKQSFAGVNSNGIADTGKGFKESKAVWDFANGTLIQNKQSWFLFLYSDTDWVKGSFEVKSTSSYNDDVPVTPEPATLAMFVIGTVLSLKRKRQ